MITVNEYCKKQFGEKLYKISLNGGMSCPNRDGKLGVRGCIFCSAGGSGDFAPDRSIPLDEQIEDAKRRVSSKYKGTHYIAYFQAYTNTYAPVEKLRALFMPVIKREDIAVLSIATRPDCLSDEVLDLLRELNDIKPVWVELGLQTIHEKTADYIRRGYSLPVYDKAIRDLEAIGIHTITHLILGLPGETKEDMLAAAKAIQSKGAQAVLVKGGHLAEEADDVLLETNGAVTWLSAQRVETKNTHGTGCTLSSAIASYLARGETLKHAVAFAKRYLTEAIQANPGLGKGNGPVNHLFALR